MEREADGIQDEREILERFGLAAFDDFMYIKENAQGKPFLNSRYNDHLHEYLVECMEVEGAENDEAHSLFILLEPVCKELNSVNWMKEQGHTPFSSRAFKQMMKNLDTTLSEYEVEMV